MSKREAGTEKRSRTTTRAGTKDCLVRLITDHENISEYVENVDKILEFWYETDTCEKARKIHDFLEKNVVQHFLFEEGIIFPTLVSAFPDPGIQSLVVELEKEHEEMFDDLEGITKVISEGNLREDRETMKRLCILLTKFVTKVMQHAAKEDERMLPVMKKNKAVFDKRRKR